MKCGQWEEAVALYAGGDLGAAESRDVERHLGDCPGCRAFAIALRESLRLLRDATGAEVSAAHCAAVHVRVMARVTPRPRRWWMAGLAAAIAASLLLMAAVWVNRMRVEPMPVLALRYPAPPPMLVPARKPERHTVMVRLMTDDPDIVLYWIAENRGE